MNKSMNLIVVERDFQDPVDIARLQAIEDNGSWCLSIHRVTHLYTYLASDARRTVCVYHAPDAEAVRDVQRQLGLPFVRVWSAHLLPGTSAGPAVDAGTGAGADAHASAGADDDAGR